RRSASHPVGASSSMAVRAFPLNAAASAALLRPPFIRSSMARPPGARAISSLASTVSAGAGAADRGTNWISRGVVIDGYPQLHPPRRNAATRAPRAGWRGAPATAAPRRPARQRSGGEAEEQNVFPPPYPAATCVQAATQQDGSVNGRFAGAAAMDTPGRLC